MSDLSSVWRVLSARVVAAGLDRRRLLTIGALAAIAMLVAGAVVLRRTPPVELTLPRAETAAASTDTGTVGNDAASAPAADERPIVHAAGAVVHPGVYPLPAGARVSDLLAAAGGPTPDADLDAINLAAKVSDGDRVYVPRRGEVPAAAAAGSGGVAGSGSAAGAVVNLNTASLEQLDSLPGVGPATAQAILDYRRQHGRFRSVDELLEVRGIGDAKLRQIRPRVRV
jgi:competence protein ComEA